MLSRSLPRSVVVQANVHLSRFLRCVVVCLGPVGVSMHVRWVYTVLYNVMYRAVQHFWSTMPPQVCVDTKILS